MENPLPNPSSPTSNPEEFWWPDPSAFDDLVVEFEDLEDGTHSIHLEAPDDTECGAWLAHFNKTPELVELFTKEFMRCLTEYAETVTLSSQK
jgi:hypothetical protein